MMHSVTLKRTPMSPPLILKAIYLGHIIMQSISWTSSGDKAPCFLDAPNTALPSDIDALIDCCVYQAQVDPCISHAHTTQTNILTMAPHTVTTTLIDYKYKTLCPYFGWLPVDTIKDTFA